MIANEIKRLMIDHLINEHNEAIGEIEAFKPLVIIKNEILDTALRRISLNLDNTGDVRRISSPDEMINPDTRKRI